MKYLFVLIFALMLNADDTFETENSSNSYGNTYVDEITSIYDGDTFRVNINSYPKIIGQKIAIRVSGVDTPEMKGQCKKEIDLARAAKQFTVNFLREAKVIELRNIQRDKYFRILADVYADNISLSSQLIKNNLGIPYFGEKKTKNWCE